MYNSFDLILDCLFFLCLGTTCLTSGSESLKKEYIRSSSIRGAACCKHTISQLVSGSYPLTRQIATILIWNSVPQSPISRSRSHRHQTFFHLFHFIFPIRFIPLLNPFSLRLFLQPRQVHLRFLLISALSFPRLMYLIHGHFIVDDPRR